MILTLDTEQEARWLEGGWSGRHIEEDILELVERAGIVEPVAVMLSTGQVAFAITGVGHD